MEMSASTLAPEIGGVKLGCASNPMRVLNRLLAPIFFTAGAKQYRRLQNRLFVEMALYCASFVHDIWWGLDPALGPGQRAAWVKGTA